MVVMVVIFTVCLFEDHDFTLISVWGECNTASLNHLSQQKQTGQRNKPMRTTNFKDFQGLKASKLCPPCPWVRWVAEISQRGHGWLHFHDWKWKKGIWNQKNHIKSSNMKQFEMARILPPSFPFSREAFVIFVWSVWFCVLGTCGEDIWSACGCGRDCWQKWQQNKSFLIPDLTGYSKKVFMKLEGDLFWSNQCQIKLYKLAEKTTTEKWHAWS